MDVHELHIWAITLGKVVLAVHVKIPPEANADEVFGIGTPRWAQGWPAFLNTVCGDRHRCCIGFWTFWSIDMGSPTPQSKWREGMNIIRSAHFRSFTASRRQDGALVAWGKRRILCRSHICCKDFQEFVMTNRSQSDGQQQSR